MTAAEMAAGGLTTAQAQERLADVGPNALPATQPRPLWRRLARAFSDPLVLVLVAAAILTLVTRDFTDAVVICLVLVVNTVVSVRQEVSADRALAALSSLTTPSCRVIRDGREQSLPVTNLVPDDVLLLAEGDLVPADAVVLTAIALRVDEATLTGESVAVDKSPLPGIGADSGAAADGNVSASSKVLAGTAVVHGRGLVRVSATGTHSALGQIAALLQGPRGVTPLQRRMARLSLVIAITAVVLCAIVLVLGWQRGEDLGLMVLAAVSLAVAAVPESLPAVVTISLSLAARRMARRQAVARNLGAVETLGSVTLLATDKTGTLTQARMEVVNWWAAPGVKRDRLWRAALLCNDARLEQDGSRAPTGEPTEVALLLGAYEAGAPPSLGVAYPRIGELPFDSVRKRMTTVHTTAQGDLLVATKGAPELMLVATVLVDPPAALAAALEQAEQLSASGLRVLALAERRTDQPAADVPTDSRLETGLTLLGLVALQDPPRLSAHSTVDACRAAGIRLTLITGDNALTAAAIARQVGLSDGEPRVLDLSQQSLDSIADLDVDVIARATPRDKVLAVQVWQRQGHVVAMTGDGVNDGPALRHADIGVAMGGRGTEVARQAADLVLKDDELATLVPAVEEGRRVYANVRRFLLYGLSGGVAEILVMLAGPFTGTALPLLPAQILWINLLTHSLTGTALGAEPVQYGTMSRPPRSPGEGVLGGGLWWRVVVLAVLVAVTGSLVALPSSGAHVQSALFVGLGAAMLGVALGARAAPHRSGRPTWAALRRPSNPLLPLSVALSTGLLVTGVELGPLQELLGTTSPGVLTYLLAAAAAVVTLVCTRMLREK